MKIFYNFCLKDDGTDLDSDILSGVRKGYFDAFQKIRDRITINSDSDSVTYDYAIEKDKPMSWSVRSQDKTLLQDIVSAGEGQYYLCFYRDEKLSKRILFSRLHTLLRVEYYDTATGLQVISLEPRKAKSGLCILYHSSAESEPTVLYPMPVPADPRVRERVEQSFAAYTVIASTDEGIVRFLSEDQERILRTFIECIAKALDREQEISYIDGEAPLFDRISVKDFNVKRNLSTALDITKAAEFSFVRESEPDSAPEEEDPEAIEVAQAAAAAISEALGMSAPAATCSDEPEADQSSEDVPEDAAIEDAPADTDSSVKPDKLIMADGAMYRYFGGLDAVGNRSGYGRTVTDEGRTAYEGSYLNDKRSGNGSYYYKDGSLCYTGDWAENARHGVGVGVSSHDGSIHVGRWAFNKPDGSGVRLGPDGDIRFVCKELSDGTTVLMNYLSDDTITVAKYDEKGKKLAEKTFSFDDFLK